MGIKNGRLTLVVEERRERAGWGLFRTAVETGRSDLELLGCSLVAVATVGFLIEAGGAVRRVSTPEMVAGAIKRR